MKYELPIILGAGIFDSENRFPSLSETSPRKVETYELEYFFEGGGISVLNGKEYPIKSGYVLFSKPSDIRFSRLPFKCKFIHFTVSDPSLLAALMSYNSVFQILNTKKTENDFNSISALFYSANPFDNITAAAKLVALLHRLNEDGSQKSLNTAHTVKQYIDDNYKEELTAQSIADLCSISVSYLHKLFKESFGITVGEYLTACRITAARDLLTNTNQSLNEIAFNCGFSSQSYFSDCFKRKTGLSPKKFRKKSVYQP